MKLSFLLIAFYAILAASIIGALFKVRENALAEMDNPKARTDWNEWREAAAKETGETTPVRRTAPNTSEPPLLLLMRDHFAAAVFGLLAPATALYVFVAWIVTGVARQSRSNLTAAAGTTQ
jgi:hypothetical protein